MFRDRKPAALGSIIGSISVLTLAVGGLFYSESSYRTGFSWELDNGLINQANYVREWSSPTQEFRYKDKVRILAVGDSFVWGDGVAVEGYTWPGHLRTMLSFSQGVEVLSWGLNGAPTYAQVDWLEDNRQAYLDASVVVIGFVSNDPVPRDTSDCRDYWCYGIPQFENSDWYKVCREGGAPAARALSRALVSIGLPGTAREINSASCNRYPTGHDHAESGYLYSDWLKVINSEESLANYSSELKRLKAIDTEGKVVFLPTPISMEDWKIQSDALALIKSEGFPIVPIPVTLALLEYPGSALAANPVNSHPGHDLAEGYAEDFINWANSEGSEIVIYEGQASRLGPLGSELTNMSVLPSGLRLPAIPGKEVIIESGDLAGSVTHLEVLGVKIGERSLLCEEIGHPYLLFDFSMAGTSKLQALSAGNPNSRKLALRGITSGQTIPLNLDWDGDTFFPSPQEGLDGLILSFEDFGCELHEKERILSDIVVRMSF